MLDSLFRACESFTFVTANRGQLDVTLQRTQNLVVTVLVCSKFGVGWATTFNYKHFMTFQPLSLEVFHFQENSPFCLVSEDGQKGTVFVVWSVGGTKYMFIRNETSWIRILLGWPSYGVCADIHDHIHTVQSGTLYWIIEMNAFVVNYVSQRELTCR